MTCDLFPDIPRQCPPCIIQVGSHALVPCASCDGTGLREPTHEYDEGQCRECSGGGVVLCRIGVPHAD